MSQDPKAIIEQALRTALEKEAPEHAAASILLERPKQAVHGDFSSNIAMQLAKSLKRNPRELAQKLVEALKAVPGFVFAASVAGPGFINFQIPQDSKLSIVRRALEEGA